MGVTVTCDNCGIVLSENERRKGCHLVLAVYEGAISTDTLPLKKRTVILCRDCAPAAWQDLLDVLPGKK